MSFTSIMRKIILTTAANRAVTSFFQKYGMRIGVQRFVAAEQLERAVDAVRKLNDQNLLVTLDYLGESVSDKALAIASTDMALLAMDAIHEHKLNSNISVKLTQLGLHIDPQFCLEQMKRLLERAAKYEQFVRIDMEDSPVTDVTIDIFRQLLEEYGAARVGLVIQSYLYRTPKDREALAKLGANLRIVKGAYNEPREVAYPKKADVDRSYVELAQAHMLDGCYTAIATHDEAIIAQMTAFAKERGISKDRFEFQMLFGISTGLQLRLAKEGYGVRVYTPFGEHWYPYFSRRIAERPANLMFVMKGMFRK